MAKEISRTFRPEFKDFEVIIEDDHGIRRPIYPAIGLERCSCCGAPLSKDAHGVRDVDEDVRKHLDSLEKEADSHASVLIKAGHEHHVVQMKARRIGHGGSAIPSKGDGCDDCG